MIDNKEFYDRTGIEGGADYLNAGGVANVQCKSTCAAKHPFNTKARQDCNLKCEAQKVAYTTAKDTIKNPTTGAPMSTTEGPAAVDPNVPTVTQGGNESGSNMGMIIGLSVLGLVVLGTAGYFIFKS